MIGKALKVGVKKIHRGYINQFSYKTGDSHELEKEYSEDLDFISNCEDCEKSVKLIYPNISYSVVSGYLHLQSGLYLDEKFKIYTAFSISKKSTVKSPVFLGKKPGYSIKLKRDTYYSTIWSFSAYNSYYHFWIDCLSKLYVLSKIDHQINLLIPEDISEKFLSLLNILLPENCSIIKTNSDIFYSSNNFIAIRPTSVNGYGHLRKSIVQYLNSCIRRNPAFQVNSNAKKIYISRNDSSKRRILNEDQLIAFLIDHGFKTYQLAGLDFIDQFLLFKDAEYVIAPHGAGLTNLLFSNKCKVMEIQSFNKMLKFFIALGKSKGLDYYLFMNPTLVDRHSNFDIDLNEFKDFYNKSIA